MEKAYRHWGHDIADEDNPLQAGLGFAVAWDKPGGFIGREALLPLRGKVPQRRLLAFTLQAEQPLLYHNEPVWRDGVMVGRTTSGMFGHTIGRPVALGYVECAAGVAADWVAAGRFELEVAKQRFPATASLAPLYDPKGLRIKA